MNSKQAKNTSEIQLLEEQLQAPCFLSRDLRKCYFGLSRLLVFPLTLSKLHVMYYEHSLIPKSGS